MLRVATISLLLGAAALIVGLPQFFPPLNATDPQAPAIVWNADTAMVTVGTPTLIDNALQLELDSSGTGLVTLAAGAFNAKNFAFLHLALEQSASNVAVTIIWTRAHDPQDSKSYTIESYEREALWLSTEEFRGWSGEIGTLSLQFSGRAGDTVQIRDFSLYPASAKRQLLAITSDLMAYSPWNVAAMNTYTGAFNSASFYPVVLAVALMVLSLLAYGLLLLLFRARLRFDPAVIVLIFFASWLILDMFWQRRLLLQLVDTHHIFAGKSTEEKLAVGPDAKLYTLVANAKPLVEAADARVFVVSSDIYFGLRTAYYFLPLNTYWTNVEPALPTKQWLRKGDYIALINPSRFSFDHKRNLVVAPQRQNLRAELVFSNQTGTVVRLK
jgi:hypothetical protein